MPPIETVPPASVVMLVKLVVPPTTPPKVVAPDVLTVSAFAPLIVEEKVMLPLAPLPLLLNVVSAPKVTAFP